MDLSGAKFATKAVHAGQEIDPATGALLAPLYMTSTYCWDPPTRERYLAGDKEGIFTYGRSRNPTQNELQQKIAALEGSENCLVTASGMAAISLAVLNCVHSGDHLIAFKTIYSGSFKLFSQIFEELRIDVTLVEDFAEDTLAAAMRPNTKAIYAESVANPTMMLLDLEPFVTFAQKHKLVSIVDNTFPSPYLLRPIEHGVDVVVHSTTKYINGHGDILGGCICGKFDFVDKIRSSIYQELGPVPSPMSCWLMLRGLKTLHLRMREHSANALRIARWLETQPGIERVMYPGLESHPQHALAKELYGDRGFGGMIGFVVKGGLDAATRFSDNVHIAKYCVSLGDCDTMIQQPPLMTHGMLKPEERKRMNIEEGLVRLSVGIEDADDIIASLAEALQAI